MNPILHRQEIFHLIWLSRIQFIFDSKNGIFVSHGVLLCQHITSHIDLNSDSSYQHTKLIQYNNFFKEIKCLAFYSAKIINNKIKSCSVTLFYSDIL